MTLRPHSLIPLLMVWMPSTGLWAQDAAHLEHFEARIRPVLIEHCYACHNSADDARGGLALDDREGIRLESDSGTAVVPGKPGESLILKVMRHELDGLEMPEDGGKLDDAVIADFEQWIRDGALDPRDAPLSEGELMALTSWEAKLEQRKEWWSFQPIDAPAVPKGAGHPVDHFITRRLSEEGLAPAPPADRRTLIRRLSYALTGLPPTTEELAAFLLDEGQGAFERVVDRLLASPRYGERWARHWMDLVRYADSHGSEGDPTIPNAFEYRDYLIRAFNEDVPYDQLAREHVAGDLLTEPRINEEEGINESAIGTAHWRLVFHGFAPTDALDEKVRFTDDAINVFSKTFLAQTVSCARCHDHKFDAISQADYYALFGILASTRPAMQDVNTKARQEHNKADLSGMKEEVRQAMVELWSGRTEELSQALAEPSEALKEEAKPEGSALHLFHEVDRRIGEGAEFDDAWAGASSDVEDDSAKDVRRWDLTTEEGRREWYATGNGIKEAGAGDFAVAPDGDGALTGIYPKGVYTHLLSSRHRGVLQSARFDLDGVYEVWFRVRGTGGASLRYVVQDYPRSGTVFPITGINSDSWTWLRQDLSYWDGDSVHLELYTGRDTALQTGGGDRAWFGAREVVLREKGAGRPVERTNDFARMISEAGAGAPASRQELSERAAEVISSALQAWGRDEATDAEALLLDACLRAELLENDLGASSEVAMIVERYRDLEREVPSPRRVPGLVEADAADHPLFVRGNHKQPGELIPRRFLEAIDATPYETESSGRLELAEDLFREDNPLTARVIVNRIWHHLFGEGLVATPDNFGRLGAEPSHPELLDHLAARMVRHRWSIKDTVRYLVMSETWRQSSASSEEAREGDPGNQWLSHANMRRLDAEAIRDSLFASAGRLDERMYGPGFGANSETSRRSVYVEARRNSLDAFLETFDAPVPFATVGARSATNVPAQSLTMLNDPLVRNLAKQWGGAMRGAGGFETDEARYAHMFESLTGREAEAAELEAISAYAEECREAVRGDVERRGVLEAEVASGVSALEGILSPVRDRLLGAVEISDAPSGPAPFARWDFSAGLEDTVGELHAELQGSARLEDGGLVLDGGGHLSTPAIPEAVGVKTLEAWVMLTDSDQSGGGVVTVQDLGGGVFDSIVYGERQARRWIAGSNNFERTDDFDGVDEALALTEFVHLAIAYDEDGLIRAYRNGAPYGSPYKKSGRASFKAGESQVLIGLRHGAPSGGRLLRGVVREARLHLRALSEEEVQASYSGGAFVSRADVLAALDDAGRERVAELEESVARGRAELSELGEPAREEDSWSRVAHAMFNLKEFLYLR